LPSYDEIKLKMTQNFNEENIAWKVKLIVKICPKNRDYQNFIITFVYECE
jgi:hypothetical protein